MAIAQQGRWLCVSFMLLLISGYFRADNGVHPYNKARDQNFVVQRMLKDFPNTEAALYADLDSSSLTVEVPATAEERQLVLDQFKAMKVPDTAITVSPRDATKLIICIDQQLTYVYTMDKHPAGFIRTFVFGNVGVIAYLSVTEEHRGKGIGGKLLTHMIHALHDEGIQDIALETDDSNEAAVHLYKKYGFIELPSKPNNGGPIFVYTRQAASNKP